MTVNMASTKTAMRRKFPKKALIVIITVLIFFGFFAFFGVVTPATKMLGTVKTLRDEARLLKDAAATQDLDQIKTQLTATNATLGVLQSQFKWFGWMQVVPFAASYYSDATHGLKAAVAGVDAGLKTVDAIYPYAGTIGLKTNKTEAFGSIKEKIAQLLVVGPQISENLSSVRSDMDVVSTELNYIDSKRYPNRTIKGINIQETLTSVKTTVSGIDAAFPDIQAVLNTLPAALGTDGVPKTYVLIFQNDKELRPTGGFWTAYALITFKNGQLVDVSSNDMYNLDAQIGLRNHPAPPAFFKGFLDVDYFYARDANISPDFVVSAAKFQDFWKLAGNAPVSGIWAMDTYVLQELLSDLGPIKTAGYDQPFDQSNVVERMETYANVLLKEQAGRKDLIGELMNSIMNKAFTAPQKDYPKLIASAVKLLQQKHILLSFNNYGVQTIVSKYNLSGQVRQYIGDYLYVNDGNFGGMKANWFVTEQITKTTTVDNGQLHIVVTIDYKNPGAYNVNWNTGYKDIVRVYVPSGAKLLSSSGSVTPVSSADELGKTYFLASVLVKPDGGTASLTFTYTLPSSIPSSGVYKLLIQKQPGTGAIPVTVVTSGKTQKVTLETDQELTANL